MFHVKHNVRNVSCETLFAYAKLLKNYIQYVFIISLFSDF